MLLPSRRAAEPTVSQPLDAPVSSGPHPGHCGKVADRVSQGEWPASPGILSLPRRQVPHCQCSQRLRLIMYLTVPSHYASDAAFCGGVGFGDVTDLSCRAARANLAGRCERDKRPPELDRDAPIALSAKPNIVAIATYKRANGPARSRPSICRNAIRCASIGINGSTTKGRAADQGTGRQPNAPRTQLRRSGVCDTTNNGQGSAPRQGPRSRPRGRLGTSSVPRRAWPAHPAPAHGANR